ncbi:hypothetical protein NOS3756_43790 [Nostoc sp. NIES-3756]|uniref:hypothetical protein n=1 Tax=Nostoc sp. NIES-3756 TaxID=1751286 RepID=UPI00071F0804|nr:hypothetical protein [Nostoc sp. NIES-3756]BAT55392.1 hypothetical protein NOS3756_43790 [Nostoc sp. NIES-3756]
MPRQKAKVESALLSKGFQETQNDHHYFIYFTKDGKKTTAKTKTSHTKKMKDIPDNLLGQMAKQCHLTKTQFLELVDCPLSRDKYEENLQQQGIIELSTTLQVISITENTTDNSHSATNLQLEKLSLENSKERHN